MVFTMVVNIFVDDCVCIAKVYGSAASLIGRYIRRCGRGNGGRAGTRRLRGC